MSNAAMLPIPQFLGTSYSGYKYYFYEIDGTTPKNAYTSSSGSSGSSLANPLTLDSNGSTSTGIWGTGYYDIKLKTSADVTVFTWENISGGESLVSSGSAASSAMSPSINMMSNATFAHWADDNTTWPTLADAAFSGALKYNVLTQSGNVDVSQLTSTSDANSILAMRLTNSHGSAQRLGLIQSGDTSIMAMTVGNTLRGQCRIRCSAGITARIMIGSWQNVSEATVDLVSNWASPTFTEGNFFIASADLEIISTSSVSLTANTWADITVSGTVPSGAIRPIMMVWTSDTIANTATFDIENYAVYESSTALNFRARVALVDEAAVATTKIVPINPNLTVKFGIPTAAKTFNFTPVMFLVSKAAVQSIGSSTDTKCNYDTEAFDIGGYYDAVTNFRHTPLIAGYYEYYHQARIVSAVDTGIVRAQIWKNGALGAANYIAAATGFDASSAVSYITFMNGTTDYVEAYVLQLNGGGNKDLSGAVTSAYFFGKLIHPLTASSF